MKNETKPPNKDVVKKTQFDSLLVKLNEDKVNRRIEKRDIGENANLTNVAAFSGDKIRNNESILQLFPDISRSIQILVSSIISPNDMSNTHMNYKIDSEMIPVNTAMEIASVIYKYIEDEYKLESDLYNVIKETLYTKGSYAQAVIPESAVDLVINGPTGECEDRTNLGIFDNDVEGDITHESGIKTPVPAELGIVFTEDFTQLANREINLRKTSKAITNILKDNNYATNVTRESKDDEETNQAYESVVNNNSFKSTRNAYQAMVELKENVKIRKKSVGKPLVIKLPTESVVVVHEIGVPEKHLGYFILLDINGNPISLTTETTMTTSELITSLITITPS